MTKPGTIGAVKGFRDVLPEESRRWHLLEDAAATTFGRYGFGEIRLPVLERTDLFARSLGEATDIVEKEMYTFPDRDETSLTLRPEATAGVVRAYLESGLVTTDPTARLFYRGPMFRRERPQRGRYRQFWQIGAEVLGRDDALADAELIVMLARYLDAVGARGVRLELNSVGDAACRPAYRERLREFGRAHLAGLCPDCHRRLDRNPLRILDCKVEGCREIVARAPRIVDHLCDACRAHLGAVRALLDQEGIAYVISPMLVRGLDYYCRTAFEAVADGLGAQNAVGGGGRYDGLVAALGGPDVPGVGFALGVERLAMVAAAAAAAVAALTAAVLPLDARAEGAALALATQLRDQGFAVGLEPSGRSLKALLRAADRRGARLAVILGEDELRAGRATIRDLARREDRRQALALDADGPALASALRALLDAPATPGAPHA
jgi:histidyl-tRNA synthetase